MGKFMYRKFNVSGLLCCFTFRNDTSHSEKPCKVRCRSSLRGIRPNFKNNAFTLVEIVAVLAIMAIVGVALNIMSTQILGAYTHFRSNQRMVSQAREIFQFLEDDIENAFVCSDDERFRFYGKDNELHFYAFRTLAGGLQVVEIGYVYDSVNKQLKRRMDTSDGVLDTDVTSGGTLKVVAENVAGFDFSYGYVASSHSGVDFVYLPDGSVWDSKFNDIANLDASRDLKSLNGLPETVKVVFTLEDVDGKKPPENYSTTVYLLQDK